MKFSEEQVKEIVALREDLMKQVDKHQEGIEMLEKNIVVLDGFLKDSSFVKASKLDTKIEPKEEIKISKPVENSIPIKRGNDGKIIANAYVTPEQVSIILDEQILINADTPPFKSFFLDRIIGEMKKKDSAEAENGKIQKESIIDYIINKNGPDIREIIIKNYHCMCATLDRLHSVFSPPANHLSRETPCVGGLRSYAEQLRFGASVDSIAKRSRGARSTR